MKISEMKTDLAERIMCALLLVQTEKTRARILPFGGWIAYEGGTFWAIVDPEDPNGRRVVKNLGADAEFICSEFIRIAEKHDIVKDVSVYIAA